MLHIVALILPAVFEHATVRIVALVYPHKYRERTYIRPKTAVYPITMPSQRINKTLLAKEQKKTAGFGRVPFISKQLDKLPEVKTKHKGCVQSLHDLKWTKKKVSFYNGPVAEREYSIREPPCPNVAPTRLSKLVLMPPCRNVKEYAKSTAYWRKKYNKAFERGIFQRFFCLNSEGDRSERFVHTPSGVDMAGWEVVAIVRGKAKPPPSSKRDIPECAVTACATPACAAPACAAPACAAPACAAPACAAPACAAV
jgi:hypothetical protein